MRIHKVEPVGLANVVALVTAIMMFIIIGLFVLFGLIFGSSLGGDLEMLGSIAGGGIFVAIIIPILYGAGTWIFAIIYALILNLALKWSGGLHIDASG